MSIDEEALLEYLDDGEAGRLTFEEFKEQQRRERYLLESPLFQRCSRSDVSRIAKCMIPLNLTLGEIVVEQGSSGNFMYFLHTGRLDAVKTTKNGTEAAVVATYSEPGAVFGELALLFDQPRAATITAKTNSSVYRLDKASFLDSMVESPIYEMAKGIILKKYQSQRLVEILPKVRLDEIVALLKARLLGRFSTKRLGKTATTFSLGAAAVVVTKAWPFKVSMIPMVYVLLGLVGYMLN
jgi:CRP-like cAMP-binding protein